MKFYAKSQVCASKNGWLVAIINNMNIDIQNSKNGSVIAI